MHWATSSGAFSEASCAVGLPPRAASMVAEAQPTNTSAAAIGKIARIFHPRGKKECDSSTSTGPDQRRHAHRVAPGGLGLIQRRIGLGQQARGAVVGAWHAAP
ncbi:hypothetical protein D3C76_1485720 [compost metagenome]